jgi:hypothetical protein
MTERVARLRAHEANVERYQRLLKANLNDVESQHIQKLLSEERFAIAMLDFMSPHASEGHDL